MTACNETQKLSGKKAVGATLAGVLAVGMVPAAAFATDEAPEGGIETLADVTASAAFSEGTLNLKVDGKAMTAADLAKNPLAGGVAHTIELVSLQPKNADLITLNATDYSITAPSTGLTASGMSITIPASVSGGCSFTLTAGTTAGTYATATKAVSFSVATAQLQNVTLFDTVDGTEKDATKTTFTYDAEAQEIGVAVDGVVMTAGSAAASGDVLQILFYKADGITPADGTNANNAPILAGKYRAYVVNAAGSYAWVDFTVNALDLTNATIGMATSTGAAGTTGSAPAIESINGVAAPGALQAQLAVALKPNATLHQLGRVECTVSSAATAADNWKDSITGTADATIIRAVNGITAEYGAGSPLSDLTKIVLTGTGANPYDASKLDVKTTATGTASLTKDDYTVTVKNVATGATGTVAMLGTPGEYIITVDANEGNYTSAGIATTKVKVYQSAIASGTNLYVTYDGQVFTDGSNITYTGSNILDSIKVVLEDNAGNALPTSAYTYKVTDAAGRTVTDATNVGKYTITVSSDTYEVQSPTVVINVVALDVTKARVAGLYGPADDAAKQFLPYTGDVITPTIEYCTNPTETDVKKQVWKALPAGTYKAAYQFAEATGNPAAPTGSPASVSEIKKAGFYTITLSQDATTTLGKNYTYGGVSNSVAVDNAKGTALGSMLWVSDQKTFVDVPYDSWYFGYIYTADELGYMHGYNDTALFGPNDPMKRGDVALVLFRMANGTLGALDDSIDFDNGFVTGFSDVTEGMYYAKAIAWAANTKIVNGYGDTGLFKPEATVTREEFATMLARYAKAVDNYQAPADVAASLDKYADGSAVADWARDAVAWAVDTKAMGNNPTLDPTHEVTRAEISKMTTVYQPEKLKVNG